MAQYVICPSCRKTVCMDGNAPVCSDCGQPLDIALIRKNNLLIDTQTEAREFAAGKDYFVNTEFLSASEHFKKALNANGNSYLSLYFVLLCDIYLRGSAKEYDIMAHTVEALRKPLELLSCANVKVNDRLNFATAALSELKIIIVNRLHSHDKVYDLDSVAYRRAELEDLQTLLQLFKIDDELLMTYSPNIRAVLVEIADTAIAVCHKAVQTVAVGEELYYPTEYEYNRLMSLNNDYCFFAQSFDPNYDVKKYTPDFTQNNLLNDKVQSRFEKFDAANKALTKKRLIGDIGEYEDILNECEKALTFTNLSCFRSMCDSKLSEREQLLKDGIGFIYRLLMPRVVMADKKKPEFSVNKFYYISDKCAMLTKFLNGVESFGTSQHDSLNKFYDALCGIADMYMQPDYDRYSKNVNKLKDTMGEEFKYYERFLFEVACATAPALHEYVPYGDSKGPRAKLVRICKKVSEEFLMLRDYRIDDIEQSNVYRPILDIYNAVMKEIEV